MAFEVTLYITHYHLSSLDFRHHTESYNLLLSGFLFVYFDFFASLLHHKEMPKDALFRLLPMAISEIYIFPELEFLEFHSRAWPKQEHQRDSLVGAF